MIRGQNSEFRSQKSEFRVQNMKREKSKSFKDLIVWQKSYQLILSVYKYSDMFPKDLNYVDSSLLIKQVKEVSKLIELSSRCFGINSEYQKSVPLK